LANFSVSNSFCINQKYKRFFKPEIFNFFEAIEYFPKETLNHPRDLRRVVVDNRRGFRQVEDITEPGFKIQDFLIHQKTPVVDTVKNKYVIF
jgi:hypothetical protein